MLKKIICPTDFSPTADNAISYAAKLCQAANANLDVYHLQAARFVESVLAGVESIEKTKFISEALENVCTEVNKAFHISCETHIEIPKKFFEQEIGAPNDEVFLVMGTNGRDDLFQRIFGSNTYNTIKKSGCPVLVVPENISYGTISKIIFGWDYGVTSRRFYPRLKNFLDVFNPEIEFLHASHHNTQISRDVFRSMKENMEDVFKETNLKISCTRIFTDNVLASIDMHVLDSNANLLVLVFREKDDSIFPGNSLIKNIIETAQYPVLILHEAA